MFAPLFQAQQFFFEEIDPAGEFFNLSPSVDGTDDEPNSDGERNPENQEDKKYNATFHNFGTNDDLTDEGSVLWLTTFWQVE
ncbi:MAG TPA: hypothetical protein VN761_05755 [Candidatus Polarisedimenticolia bacterium]|nr:hypothetical protein [Candidatus Polarisedimenticolia bacterium]